VFSGREYQVKVSGDPKINVNQGHAGPDLKGNAVGLVARGNSCVALFRQGDEEDGAPWVFMTGRPALFRAALAVLPE